MDSRGIEYFDDVNCLIPKWHKAGTKNLYKVIVKYKKEPDEEQQLVIEKSYGSFKTAYVRFVAEMDDNPFDDNKFQFYNSVKVICNSYDGTRMTNTDELLSSSDSAVIREHLV